DYYCAIWHSSAYWGF
nr:immunoglobulin light chain junction region [Macaca mulatta]MOX17030.1 immunoglobulin light chain junction region [Macaca mulatta]MOX17182.1 immunoglobulin light chain junction region [Macaca mulatta]MOX17596.1 immunoglobulin light chain junction region [Macaca mulatta]MOX18457.1 immunoglobulin light chain junction region [Macaca mulatta]